MICPKLGFNYSFFRLEKTKQNKTNEQNQKYKDWVCAKILTCDLFNIYALYFHFYLNKNKILHNE